MKKMISREPLGVLMKETTSREPSGILNAQKESIKAQTSFYCFDLPKNV